MAFTDDQGQLPGPVSTDRGREEEKQGDPSPPGGNAMSCRCLSKKGLQLTQGMSSSWKAMSYGKGWLPLVLWLCTQFLVRHSLIPL